MTRRLITNFSKRATNDMSNPDDRAGLTAQRGLENQDDRWQGRLKPSCTTAVSWFVQEATE
jgi:hypothetical protein